MVKYRRLSQEERLRAVFMAENGENYSKIATILGSTASGIRKIVKKYQNSGSTADKASSGRPKKTTAHTDRVLVRMSLQDRRLTAPQLSRRLLEEHGVNLASRTVRKRLQKAGLRGCVAAKKPLLSAANVRRRLVFAREHKDWTVEDWKNVIFSDESLFQLFCGAKRLIVRRRVGEKFKKDCIAPTVKHDGGSVMIWGSISGHGVGQLYRCIGSMNQGQYIGVLQDSMLPSADTLFGQGNRFIFQHDNAPCHKAKKVTNFLRQNGVDMLDWPAQSPDMNPIENLWSFMSKSIEGKKPSNLDDLWILLQGAWNNIPQTTIDGLFASMPSRMRCVIKARGYHTKY